MTVTNITFQLDKISYLLKLKCLRKQEMFLKI